MSARQRSRSPRQACDARPTSRPPTRTTRVDVCPLTPAPSRSTPTRIAVPTGTSRGVSTRTIRTFGARSPVTVTVATGAVRLKPDTTVDGEGEGDRDGEGG